MAQVDMIKDRKVIYSTQPRQRTVRFEFTDRGDVRGRHYYSVLVQQEDSTLAWSRPFFVNYQ
jgi:hypothetical protein